MSRESGSEFPYHPKPLVDLAVSISCNGYELNDKPALIGLCETLDDEEQVRQSVRDTDVANASPWAERCNM